MSRNSRPKPQVQPLDDRTVPAVLAPSISGLVFADLNASGVQEAGEPALVGVPVILKSGTDGTTEQATLTKADGTFSLPNVSEGLHLVTVSPTGSGPNSGDVVRAVSITGGQSVGPIAFGVRASGSVAGSAFVDVNGNGRRDAGDSGVGGVAVTLDLFASGTAPLTTTTAADGSYKFSGVPDGQHKLTFTGSAAQGGTVGPTTVSVIGGANATAVDGALRPTSAVTGTVTLGPAAAGGPGLPGITVSLDLNSDGRVDAVTLTDASGNYLFAGVPAGTHVVTFAAPGASGFDTADRSNRLVLNTTGDVKGGNNIGVSFSGKIQGSTFIDPNGDGKFAAGDIPIIPATVQVDLFNSGRLVTVPTQSQGGSYYITNIPDGAHTLVITPPGGYKATTAVRLPATVTNGGTATVTDVGYRAAGGATVAVGNGDAPGATVYTFTPGPNGSLTSTQGSVTTPAGKSGLGTRAITADVNGDGVDDLITGAGPGGSPIVRIYDGRTNQELVAGGILVFESSFLGGLNLSAGDFLKTGRAQLVVSADTGGGPRVMVLNPSQYMAGADPTKSKVLADFFGIDDTAFRGGARTAVGDLNGDGTPDLVVAAGAGGGPRVAVFDGRTVGGGAAPVRLTSDFFAFEAGLRNGAVVSVGDINGNGLNDLVVGAGPGGSPRVTVFDGRGIMAGQGADGQRLADFFVNGDSTSRLGTRLTVKDLDGDGKADVIATNGARAYVFTGPSILATYLTGEAPVAATILNPFPQTVRGGLFVG